MTCFYYQIGKDANVSYIKLSHVILNYSLGYGSEAMDASGACAMTPSGQSYISVNISSRSSFVTTATTFGGSPLLAGYICEKESENQKSLLTVSPYYHSFGTLDLCLDSIARFFNA